MLDAETELATKVRSFKNDPYGFTLWAYPWGQAGTFLEKFDGPEPWQADVLKHIRDRRTHDETETLQLAVRSGHGIGKGALSSWLVIWFISTRLEAPEITVTANTKTQLTTKTWRELAKWHNVAINKHWFKWTATKFYAIDHPETWYATAIPQSEHNSEAFAGTHEQDVMLEFDESSNIPDVIWEVASGAMTTPGALWFAFGNPTKNTGRFRECFGKFKARWKTFKVDSREVSFTDKKQIQEWIDDYGEDSDFVRVRVKGDFPRSSTNQFISNEMVDSAIARDYKPEDYRYAPITIGADIAREGDDQTVFVVRQGVKVLDIRKHRELDLMASASHISMLEEEYKRITPHITIYVELNGMGAGVYDRLMQLGRQPLGIDTGGKSADLTYFNKRTEMWAKMRDWLRDIGQIPEDDELKDDLIGPEFGFSATDKVQLEKKKDMKGRGLASPDTGDALALTFALPPLHDYNKGGYDEDDYFVMTGAHNGRQACNPITGY